MIVVQVNGLTNVRCFLCFDILCFRIIYTFCNLNVHLLHLFYCQVAVGQSISSDVVLRPPLPQVVELSGSESPSVMNWNSRIQRARQDISRSRLRAIESSLENGQIWVPPSPAHRKTWEEEVTVLSFLFLFDMLFWKRKNLITHFINCSHFN